MAALDVTKELERGYDALGRHALTEADAAADAVLAATPDLADGYRLRARVQLERGDLAGAVATLEDAAAKAREPAAAFVDLAELHLGRADGRRALEAALAARERAGDTVRFVVLTGRARWLDGRTEEALFDFEHAAPYAPDRADVQLPLARAYAALGRGADALRVLDGFLARRPHGGAEALRIHLRFDPDAPAAALAAADAASRALPDDPDLRLLAAALSWLVGGPGADEPRAALERDPRLAARWEGFERLCAAGGVRFLGLPHQVLDHALGAATVAGHTAEFGVFTGRSLARLAARTAGPVHAFDWFRGTPAAGATLAPPGSFDLGGVAPLLTGEVVLHAGPFVETVPAFAASAGPARLWHVDTDHAPSTAEVLDALGGALVPGSIVVFDDYAGFPGASDQDQRVWREFAERRGLAFRPIAATLLGREVAVLIEGAR